MLTGIYTGRFYNYNIWVNRATIVPFAQPSLDKYLNFVYVGNSQDRAKFSTHFVHFHEILPYPLPDMCRKCEEISCFDKQDMQEIWFLVQCLHQLFYSHSTMCSTINKEEFGMLLLWIQHKLITEFYHFMLIRLIYETIIDS